MNNNIFYVYFHRNPYTEEIVYVGKGCHGRAWDVTRSRSEHKEHQNWMKQLCLQGFVPSDWVEIVKKALSEVEAHQQEKTFIHQIGPKFNRQNGESNNKAKLTNQQAIEIYELANQIKTNLKQPLHQEIADKYGVSRTCVSMIANVKQWKAVLIPYLKGKNG